MELPNRPLASAVGVGSLTVIVRDAGSGKWRVFERPKRNCRCDEYRQTFCQRSRRSRRHASIVTCTPPGSCRTRQRLPSIRALTTQRPDDFPLLWFGVFDHADERTLDELGAAPDHTPDERWQPSISAEQYARVFEELQELIRNGDTYQVNYTYRLRAHLESDPLALFLRLIARTVPAVRRVRRHRRVGDLQRIARALLSSFR